MIIAQCGVFIFSVKLSGMDPRSSDHVVYICINILYDFLGYAICIFDGLLIFVVVYDDIFIIKIVGIFYNCNFGIVKSGTGTTTPACVFKQKCVIMSYIGTVGNTDKIATMSVDQ